MKTCEKCGQEFLCQPENITACFCSKITISLEVRNFLTDFYDCLCEACLTEFEREVVEKRKHKV